MLLELLHLAVERVALRADGGGRLGRVAQDLQIGHDAQTGACLLYP